jgi:Prenyltransferase and squalene oxidase repeat
MNTPSSFAPQEQPPVEVVIEEANGGDQPSRFAAVPAWLLSFGMHGILVAAMAALVFAKKEESVIPPPMKINIISEKPKTPEKEKTAIKPSDLSITVAEVSDIVNPIESVQIEIAETKQEADVPDEGNPGRTDAVASVETEQTGAFMMIGAGSQSSGIFSNRSGQGRKRVTGKYGTASTRASSIESALRWFKRHQSPNGMWDVDGYQVNCQLDGGKCEPGINQKGNADIACTAYAVMCFQGMGYTHTTPNTYRMTMEKGIDWLLAQQNPDGSFGERNYEHAIATMAIVEACAMGLDSRLRGPGQKAVDFMLSRQALDPQEKDPAYAGLGWDYTAPKPTRNDTSVTGWNVMALKSALGSGFHVGTGLEGSKRWLERAWKAANPEWKTLDPYTGVSVFPYTYDATTDTVGNGAKGESKLVCVGAICSVFLGHHAGDPMLSSLCNYIMQNNVPKSYPTNTYYLYYNTMAVFQAGAAYWEKWDKPVSDLLANAQRNDDNCFNGSWDFAGTGFHGHDTGRLLSTAYACLSQEVIWRYTQVADKKVQ